MNIFIGKEGFKKNLLYQIYGMNLILPTKKEIDAGPMGIHTTFQQDGKDVAGMMNPTGPTDKPRWSAYIAVDNINDCILKVENHGGKVLVKPQDIPDMSHVCLISNSVGAIIYLMQPISNK